MLKSTSHLDWAKVVFGVATLALVFAYGVIVGRYQVFPFSILQTGQDSIMQVIDERDTLLGIRPTYHLFPRKYDGDGVTRNLPNQAVPGLTLVAGSFGGNNQLKLVRLDGSVANQWSPRFFDLFPNSDFIRPEEARPQAEWNVAIHGALAMPDGSVVFNFEPAYGSARLDRCGVVQWTLPQMTHHSVERSESGGFWIPSRRYVDGMPEFPFLETPYYDDTVLRVSEDGEVLSELSVLEILYRNNLEGFMFGRRYWTGDVTHLNDVEELKSDMAGAFPGFAAGDLMLSLRMEHLVLVVDPDTLEVKWYRAGPWIGQHDPDFQENGTIVLFSNNNDGTGTAVLGGSTIIEVDPQTGRIGYRYGTRPDQTAYTPNRGKQQIIGDNRDHILVTEAQPGRVFEIDSRGSVVWEFVNRYDDEDAGLITGARRYSEDYFTVEDWSCEQGSEL